MTHQHVSRTNQQTQSDTPLVSGILQRAAVRNVPEKDVQPTEEEATTLRESRFHHNFSQVPASTGEMPRIQPKLKIGAVGDRYEQEADRVAQDVVQRINAPAPERGDEDGVMRKTQEGTLQREEMAEEEDDKQLRMKPMVQRLSAESGMATPPDLDSSIQRARGGGQPLGDGIRESMERVFGADFSGVKVHTDSHSDQLNQSIQAKAFTTGQDVFFRHGAYQPGSRGGQELIAHELTHVVQQNGDMGQRASQPKQTLYPLDSRERREGQNVEARLGLQKSNLDESMLQAKWSGEIPMGIKDMAMKSKLTEMNPAAANIPVWKIQALRTSETVYDTYQKVLAHFGLTGSTQQEPQVETPAKKVAAPTEKVEVPTEKVEVPTEKVEVPTEKMEVPTKKVDSSTFKFLIPKNLELKNLIRGDSRERKNLIKDGFKPGKAVKDYFNKLKDFLDKLKDVKKSEEISRYMKDREPNKAILNPEAKLHQQIDLVWSQEKIEVSGGRKITLLNYVCTGIDSGAGGNDYLIKVDEEFECISASPTLGLYQSASGLQVLAMASSASAGKEGGFVKFHEYDFLTPIPPEKIYYSSKDNGTNQVVKGGDWFNVVTGKPL